jgi:hypothetical protein
MAGAYNAIPIQKYGPKECWLLILYRANPKNKRISMVTPIHKNGLLAQPRWRPRAVSERHAKALPAWVKMMMEKYTKTASGWTHSGADNSSPTMDLKSNANRWFKVRLLDRR